MVPADLPCASTQVTELFPFTLSGLSFVSFPRKLLIIINCPTENLGEILEILKSNPLILQIKQQGEWPKIT